MNTFFLLSVFVSVIGILLFFSPVGKMDSNVTVTNDNYGNLTTAIFDMTSFGITIPSAGIYPDKSNSTLTNGGKSRPISTIDFVGMVIHPLVTILGLIGNALIVITTTRSGKMSVGASKYYLTTLAFTDSITLICQILNKPFMVSLFGYDIRALVNAGCKMFWTILRTAKMTSSWIIVFISIDRFFVTHFPLRARDFSTKTIALTEMVITVLITGTFNSYWTYACGIVKGKCVQEVYDRTEPEEVAKYQGMLTTGTCLAFIIPMIIMAITTPLIIFELCKQRRIRKKLTIAKTNNKQDTKMTLILIAINITFLLFVSPEVALHNVSFFTGASTSAANSQKLKFYKKLAQMFGQLNYAINFLLYIFASSNFKKEITRIICRRKSQVLGSRPVLPSVCHN